MSFSKQTVDEVLIKCGRRCALCHTFCGTKIELHHIVQKRDGGPNSFDNCIPLCFNCHSEVKAYNPKHPKGRPFSAKELKGHRDRWYKQIEELPGDEKKNSYLGEDRKLFQRILKIMPFEKVKFVKEHDYGSLYPIDSHDFLLNFIYELKNPEFEFFNKDLEERKADLKFAISKFLDLFMRGSHHVKYPEGFARIFPAMLEDDDLEKTKRWSKYVEKVNFASKALYFAYEQLVKLGRRELKKD